MKNTWANTTGTGMGCLKWANVVPANVTGMKSKWANQTGGATTPATDYTYNPAGVNPQYTNYLASAGTGDGGDPLSTTNVKALAGGNFGGFWKIIFPMGTNDCDLQAAISNITAKIAQFQGMVNYSGGSGVASKIGGQGLKAYVQNNLPKAQQGDAYAYISNSVGTLQTLLNQYQAQYQSNSAKGGGCANGMTEANYLANQKAQTQAQQQLATEAAAAQQAAQLAPLQAQAAANTSTILAQAAANEAPIQGAAAGQAAQAATSSISPVTIGLVVAGVAVVGIIFVLFKGKPTAPAAAA